MRQTGQLYAVRPESNPVPVIMRASFFRLVLRNKTGFPELGHFLFGAIRVPVRPEITHRLPTKRDAKAAQEIRRGNSTESLLSQ